MSEVKWIKILVNIFDDDKIRFIETLPDGDTILVIWFKILTLAGRSNKDGYIMLTDQIPYTEEMLKTFLNKKDTVVKLALETFKHLEMIEIVDERFILVSNWSKHQNVLGLEKIKEQNRIRQQKYREKNKLSLLENKRLKEKEEERDIDTDNVKSNVTNNVTDYQSLLDYFNSLSFRKVKTLTATRKKHLNARLKEYGETKLKELWNKADKNPFMHGENNRAWSANFDWLINQANLVKLEEGNYERNITNKTKSMKEEQTSYESSYSIRC